jgi:hypothetical protein
MARKRVTKVQTIKEVKTEDVPMRFMMPRPEYDELGHQARKLGLSKSSYAKMLIMEQVAVRKGGAK